MKKIMLASMVAAAAIFTACESSDDLTSCDIEINLGMLGSMHTCGESSDAAYVRQSCAEVNADAAEAGLSVKPGKVGSGCPSGAAKVCTGPSDGVSITAYFYDADDAKMSCEYLMSEEDEDDYYDEDDYGFTPDDPEYYSKLKKFAGKKK